LEKNMDFVEKLRKMEEANQKLQEQNREVLFENEKFAIGVLQAVCGGALVAAIAQIENLRKLVPLAALYWFVTLALVALSLAVLAAYFKHQYKLWDVKSPLAKDNDDAKRRAGKTSFYLKWMRITMGSAVVTILVDFGLLAISLWVQYLK